MRCPQCNQEDTRVIETLRPPSGGVRRRRECKNCNHRFVTYEEVVLTTPKVRKRSGEIEEFDLDNSPYAECAKLDG